MSHSPTDSRPSGIIKEGEVTKQGGRIKTWKKRWCVLVNTGLIYYKNQENEAMRYNNIQGQIDLDSIESVEPALEKAKKKFCFKIVTPSRTFLIAASDTEEMESWIAAIKDLRAKSGKDTDYLSKSVEELEQLLSTLDERMKSEVNRMIDGHNVEKDLILDELMKREMEEVKKQYASDLQELAEELQRRENN